MVSIDIHWFRNGGIMKLINERVKHQAFGQGIIMDMTDDSVTVKFETIELAKTFVYPDALETFLMLENKSLLGRLEEVKQAKEDILQEEIDAENEAKAIEEAHQRRLEMVAKKPLHLKSKNNIAFKCTYCNGGQTEEAIGFQGVCSDEMITYNIKEAKQVWCANDTSACQRYLQGELTREALDAKFEDQDLICYESQMLSTWSAFAGVVQSGKRKGQPMTLRNVTPNSLAVLTTKKPEHGDEARFIFAVYIIDESYEGENRAKGHVVGHKRYRMTFTEKESESLLFWHYYFNEKSPENIKFGSGLHRYWSNMQSAQLLKDIIKVKKGTEDEALAKKMFLYYCRTHEMHEEMIDAPEGGLIRINKA